MCCLYLDKNILDKITYHKKNKTKEDQFKGSY